MAAILAPPLALTGGGGRATGVVGVGPRGAALLLALFVGVPESFSLSLSLSLSSFLTFALPIVSGITLLLEVFFFDFFSLLVLVEEEASSFEPELFVLDT